MEKLLTAHNRLHSAPDVWLPITCSVFHHLALAENHTNFSAFQQLLYKTMFLVAFYCFFRLGELTAKGANIRPLLHVEDLSFQSRHSCVTSASVVINMHLVRNKRHSSGQIYSSTVSVIQGILAARTSVIMVI